MKWDDSTHPIFTAVICVVVWFLLVALQALGFFK